MMSFLHSTKPKREILIVWALFFLSCLHQILLYAAMAALLLYVWKQGVTGAVKALFLISLRTPINTSFAVPISILGYVKWAYLVGLSIYILLKYRKIVPTHVRVLKRIILINFFFSLTVVFGAFINASYPVTALFKVLSYFLTSSAILIGMAIVKKQNELIEYVVDVFSPVIFFSLLGVVFTNLNHVNGTLQGLLNHPNMLAILVALYIAFYIERKRKMGKGNFLVVVVCLLIVFLTTSRTGMLASFFAVLVGGSVFFPNRKYLLQFLMVFAMACVLLLPSTAVGNAITEFLFKGHTGDIFYSRREQIELYMQKFHANPILGSGFNVPYYPYTRDFSLNMNLVVEPGNILWGVLGDCGIFGILFLMQFFLKIFLCSQDHHANHKVLFYTPLLVCMGEMAFFSVNNIAIILYVCLGCYLFSDPLPDDVSKKQEIMQ